jgi:ATP-dependent RNA helicase RhlE
MRLVGDIERLIKTKIELEPYELVDDRPRRAPYRERERLDERPQQADAAQGDGLAPARSTERAPREFDRPRRPAQPPADPFFEKPYEPPADGAEKPAWEQKSSTVVAPVRGLSPNIRSKRKVASLLGGGNKA